MFRATVAGGPKLQAVANDLRRAGGKLRPDLTAGLSKETKAIDDEVRRVLDTGSMAGRRVSGSRRFPSGVGTGNHVRGPAKRGLSWKVSSSAAGPRAEILWDPRKLPLRIQPLFAHLVGQKSRLRHPVMGKTRAGTWRGGVGQNMPNAWQPVKKLLPRAQKAAAKAVDLCAARINGRKR
jgi:hypothetical protein